MPANSSRPLFTPLQWAALFIVIPLWVLQVRYTINYLQEAKGISVWKSIDFTHYYVTSERVLDPSAAVYCTEFTAEETVKRGIETRGIREPTNPPLLTLALSPLAYASLFQAWLVYTTIGLAALAVALWMTMKRCNSRSSTAGRAFFLLLILASSPMVSLLTFSQVQSYVLALILCAWLLAARHPTIAGITLGITMPLKIYTAPLLAFMVMIRDYRMFLYALSAAGLGTLLPELLDPRLNLHTFLSCGASHVSTWAEEASTTQSVPSILRSISYHILLPLQITDLATIKEASRYGGLILWIASGFVVGWVFRKRSNPRHGLLAATAFSALCAPVAWPHYFLLTWPYLIQQWSRLSLGTRLIVWFSFPLYPCYMIDADEHDWIATITDLTASPLVWIPGSIFTLQLALIFYRDITRREPIATTIQTEEQLPGGD